jgi:hypothetical protein
MISGRLGVRKNPRFICQNPACRSEIEVIELSPKSRSEDSGNPRCRCGSEMKKVFTTAHLRELTPEQAARYLMGAELPQRMPCS